MELSKLLKLTIERNASDLHLIPNYFPTLRINGELLQIKTLSIINPEQTKQMLLSILTEEQKERLMVNRELDFGYNFEERRFRVNMYFTLANLAASLRLIPGKINPLEYLNLPPSFHKFTDIHQGFVLFTGPTGEGKSTSLASIINEINLKYAKHILTIEDPIEYIYPKAKSIISQRELGQDTHSWLISLRAAFREDPDVLLIGEMRDYETIQAALTIAETGHLVFSTLHTNSAAQTIDRIIDVFPPHQQNQIKVQLSAILKAVVAQRLLPTIDNTGRIPACEMLFNTPAIASVVREGKTHLIDNIIQTSAKEGMILMEQYIHNLYQEGKISKETAINLAIRPEEIKKLIESK